MRHVKLLNLTRKDIYRPLFGRIKARDFIVVDKSRVESLVREYPNLIGRSILVKPIIEKRPPVKKVVKPVVEVIPDPILQEEVKNRPGRKKKQKEREFIIVKEQDGD